MAMKLSYEWVFLTTYPSPGSPSSVRQPVRKTARSGCENCLRLRCRNWETASLAPKGSIKLNTPAVTWLGHDRNPWDSLAWISLLRWFFVDWDAIRKKVITIKTIYSLCNYCLYTCSEHRRVANPRWRIKLLVWRYVGWWVRHRILKFQMNKTCWW